METGTGIRRIALIVSYDGSAFFGYQIQDAGRTVQCDLEKALSILCRESIRVTAAGRTDSGVHALCQVVHFDTTSFISLQKICLGANGILKSDVSLLNAFEVNQKFHARFAAYKRTYQYQVYNYPLRSPLMMCRALWYPEKIDIFKLNKILEVLQGEHDFASFCKKKSSDMNTVRTIETINVESYNEIIKISITGNAFLHNMIRIIVGTSLEILKKKGDESLMREILEKKDRDSAGPTAPPCGLYFARVYYNPALDTYPSAY